MGTFIQMLNIQDFGSNQVQLVNLADLQQMQVLNMDETTMLQNLNDEELEDLKFMDKKMRHKIGKGAKKAGKFALKASRYVHLQNLSEEDQEEFLQNLSE